ncbi:MAG: epoxyqueuosine reductase QueH [Deltaproteobacteria bacterium]|nr:epoxyqueuosine reductase QueH [Deltaproteobacteria bacterium]
MRRILVHMCCGPCSIYPLKKMLGAKDLSVTGFFYNPNIHPFEEFRKRLDAVKTLATFMAIDVVLNEDYEPGDYFRMLPKTGEAGWLAVRDGWLAGEAGWLAGEAGGTADAMSLSRTERCRRCYAVRLEKTASEAKKTGYDFFSSSLLYSKYQMHESIISLGADIGRRYGVPFWYEDFRTGWKEGVRASKEIGLYRQSYCGCIFSKVEREMEVLGKKMEMQKKKGARDGKAVG